MLIAALAAGGAYYFYANSPSGRVRSILGQLRTHNSTGWFTELRQKYGYKDAPPPDQTKIEKELVNIGPSAVPALIDALGYQDARASVAARALGMIADDRCIQALVQYLKDDKSQTLDGPGEIELAVSHCCSPTMVAEMIKLLPEGKSHTVLLWMKEDIDLQLEEATKTASPQLRKCLEQIIADRHYKGPGWGYPGWPRNSTSQESGKG